MYIMNTLVEKVVCEHISISGEEMGWWHKGQHGSRSGRNTTDALLWLIRRVRKNREKQKHTALVMMDVAAAFPNTSYDEIANTLQHAHPTVRNWVSNWLQDRSIQIELDGNRSDLRSAGKGLPQGSPLSPVLFGLACANILKELPEGCSYVDDCAWAIPIEDLQDKRMISREIKSVMEIASSTFRKHSMELDTGKTEIAIVFKVERANKKWEAAANDWKLRWMNKEYKFKKGPTRWLGSHIDRSMNWKAHVSTCVERALWKQQKVRRFMLAHGVNRKLARTIAWSHRWQLQRMA